MNLKKILYVILVILLFPSIAQSIPRIIHAEWEYQSYEDVSGYRLYHENSLVCATADPTATAMDCTVDASDGESQFYLTSYFQDGTESPPSAPFSYIFSSDLKAIFTADPLAGESPLPVSFDATSSTGNIISYEWIFSDGATGSGNTVSHTFASAGNYTVTLKVTNDLGATDQETVQIVVSSPSPINNPPTAIISSSTSVGDAPLEVQFDGSGSSDSDGAIILYEWDMGDGGTSTGPQVAYTYTSAGTFNATLSVTDDGGLIDSSSTPVIITQPPEENNLPPVAVISASIDQGFAPLAVTFDAGESNDPDGTINSYKWNFGDGSTSFNMTANYIYTQPASYEVTLEVTDNVGASTMTSYVVNVQPGVPEPSIPIEIGEISITNDWFRVDMTKEFVHPIVIAGPLSYADMDPAVIRIRNVDETGFDIRIQEWDYLDGFHAHETIQYIVMEQGNYTLSNGARIEAGSFTARHRFRSQEFNQSFQVKPVLFSTISSFNEEDAVTGRYRRVATNGFEYKLSEQERNRRSRHADENVGYIAWEPGSGSVGSFQYEVGKTDNSVTSLWHQIDFQSQFTERPFFIADMQSYNSRENAAVRYNNLSPFDVYVKIEEETSKDRETDHIPEAVGYMGFAPGSSN